MIRSRDELLDICNYIARGESWAEVAAGLARFEEGHAGPELPREAFGRPQIDTLLDWLFTILFEHFTDPVGTTAADLLGHLKYRTALEQGMSIGRIVQLLQLDRGEAAQPTLITFLASLAEIAQTVAEGDRRYTVFDQLVALAPELGELILSWRSPLEAAVDDAAEYAYVPAYRDGPMPGDCVFRELSVRPLSQFGHVGIYLGSKMDAPLDSHVVLHMRGNLRFNLWSDCEMTTVRDFKRGGGAFWGFYAVDLDVSHRQALLAKALSYRGRCRYSVVSYKSSTTRSFRCDGFVEHCYESITLPPSLDHRRGLFEDDTVSSLTPAGLRNAMFYKR